MTVRYLSRRPSAMLALLAVPLALAVWAWQAASWRPKIVRLSTSPITDVAWTHAVLQVATDVRVVSLDAVSLESNNEVKLAPPADTINFTLSPDGATAAFSGGGIDDAGHSGIYSPDYWVALADAHTGKRTHKISACDARSLAFSPDGTRFFEGAESCGPTPAGEGGSWALLEVRRQKFSRVVLERDEPVQFAIWSRDGKHVWFALRGGAIGSVTRDGQPGRRFKPFPSVLGDERDVTAFALSRDEKMVALATEETGGPSPDLISVIDANSGRVLRTWHPGSWTKAVDFSPDNEQLAFATTSAVTLCSPLRGEVAHIFAVKGASSLAFSPHGSRLAVGTLTGQVQVWRAR